MNLSQVIRRKPSTSRPTMVDAALYFHQRNYTSLLTLCSTLYCDCGYIDHPISHPTSENKPNPNKTQYPACFLYSSNLKNPHSHGLLWNYDSVTHLAHLNKTRVLMDGYTISIKDFPFKLCSIATKYRKRCTWKQVWIISFPVESLSSNHL